MKENKGKPNVMPEVEAVHLLGFITEVLDVDTGEYEIRFKPNSFGHVKNMEELK